MFCVCELYKLYVESLCFSQSFTIKKAISMRYDLSHPLYEEKFAENIPSLNLITGQYFYKQNDYIKLNPAERYYFSKDKEPIPKKNKIFI